VLPLRQVKVENVSVIAELLSMKDDNEEVKKLKARIEILERQVEYDRRVFAVLVAVGALPEHKLEQARDIRLGTRVLMDSVTK
jgi:histidine ammonia-lyase